MSLTTIERSFRLCAKRCIQVWFHDDQQVCGQEPPRTSNASEQTDLAIFFSFVNWYAEFVQDNVRSVHPASNFMRLHVNLLWSENAQGKFENTKDDSSNTVSFCRPTFGGDLAIDGQKKKVEIYGNLHLKQKWNGESVLLPVFVGSKTFNLIQTRHGAPKRQMFQALVFIKYFTF